MQEGPSTLIIYSDGTTPQYGLREHDKRTLVAVYWSLSQINEFMFSEDDLFSIAVIRNTDWRSGIDLRDIGTLVVDAI